MALYVLDCYSKSVNQKRSTLGPPPLVVSCTSISQVAVARKVKCLNQPSQLGGVVCPRRLNSKLFVFVALVILHFQSVFEASYACSLSPKILFPRHLMLQTQKPMAAPRLKTTETVNVKQVWSLIQFHSVDFSKSWIGVKKCVFNNAQSRYVSAVFDGVLGPT